VSTTFPPLEPGRHGWAELLSLVGAVRRLAYDRSHRIRDTFDVYNGRIDEGGSA